MPQRIASNQTAVKPFVVNGPIPVREVGCTGASLNLTDFIAVKDQMEHWSNGGGRVGHKNWHAEFRHGVVWYMCNCKLTWEDSVPREELDHALALMNERCGVDYSGWVWSKLWEKGFNLQPATALVGRRPPQLCPHECLWHHIGE
ncbi:hypothetical protein JX266_010239 [Neoarthrinium moseri]|nr:hypothetical protein JX266_010239 [Neoarthrinium moseri]